MNWTTLIAPLMALIGTLSATGPWGIAAIVLVALGAIGLGAWGISKINSSIDNRDAQNASNDAGASGQSMQNQIQDNKNAINDMEKNDPVKPPVQVVTSTVPADASIKLPEGIKVDPKS